MPYQDLLALFSDYYVSKIGKRNWEDVGTADNACGALAPLR
jgi:hypothetical protein